MVTEADGHWKTRSHCSEMCFLEGQLRRMPADGCVLWSWHGAAAHAGPEVGLLCGLRGQLRTWTQRQEGKKNLK